LCSCDENNKTFYDESLGSCICDSWESNNAGLDCVKEWIVSDNTCILSTVLIPPNCESFYATQCECLGDNELSSSVIVCGVVTYKNTDGDILEGGEAGECHSADFCNPIVSEGKEYYLNHYEECGLCSSCGECQDLCDFVGILTAEETSGKITYKNQTYYEIYYYVENDGLPTSLNKIIWHDTNQKWELIKNNGDKTVMDHPECTIDIFIDEECEKGVCENGNYTPIDPYLIYIGFPEDVQNINFAEYCSRQKYHCDVDFQCVPGGAGEFSNIEQCQCNCIDLLCGDVCESPQQAREGFLFFKFNEECIEAPDSYLCDEGYGRGYTNTCDCCRDRGHEPCPPTDGTPNVDPDNCSSTIEFVLTQGSVNSTCSIDPEQVATMSECDCITSGAIICNELGMNYSRDNVNLQCSQNLENPTDTECTCVRDGYTVCDDTPGLYTPDLSNGTCIEDTIGTHSECECFQEGLEIL